MNEKIIPELFSKRVLLRKMNLSLDLAELFRVMRNPEVHRWTGNKPPTNIIELQQEMNSFIESKEITFWAVVGIDIKKIIGIYWIMNPMEDISGKRIILAEIQKTGKEYWRKGYMKEARRLVYNYCFNQLKVDIIYAQVWEDNINSCKSLENAGFKCYGKEKKKIEEFGTYYNECFFMLTEDNWKKSNLMRSK